MTPSLTFSLCFGFSLIFERLSGYNLMVLGLLKFKSKGSETLYVLLSSGLQWQMIRLAFSVGALNVRICKPFFFFWTGGSL